MSKSTATATSEPADEVERQVAVDDEVETTEPVEPTQEQVDEAIAQAHADAGLSMTPTWSSDTKGGRSADQDRGSKGVPLPGTIPEDETGEGGADTGPAGNDASASADDDAVADRTSTE